MLEKPPPAWGGQKAAAQVGRQGVAAQGGRQGVATPCLEVVGDGVVRGRGKGLQRREVGKG